MFLSNSFLISPFRLSPFKYSVFGVDSTWSADFINNANLPQNITFSRASQATRINPQGLVELVNINTPRFDYDISTLTPKGLLIEGPRTNLVLTSTSFSGGASATLTPNNTTAPDGTNTATKVVFSDSTAAAVTYTTAVSVSTSTSYTGSLFIRSDTPISGLGLRIDTSGGSTWAGNTIVTVNTTTGWQRVDTSAWVSGTNTTGRVVIRASTDSIGKNIYIWGGQLEAGSFVSSYIPTSGASATRAKDIAVISTLNSIGFNTSEGTFFCAFTRWATAIGDTTASVVLQADDGTESNRLSLFAHTPSIFAVGNYYNPTLTLAPFSDVSRIHKIAAAYISGNSAASADASAVVSSSASTTAATTFTELGIGSRPWGGALRFLNGHIRQLDYYPYRLSNSQLLSLTS